MTYSAMLYRVGEAFSESILKLTLESLHRSTADFFPLKLRVAPSSTIELQKPSDFSRKVVPPAFFIDKENARIPFEASNGADVCFTESTKPYLYPANMEIELPKRLVEAWGLPRLILLVRGIVSAFRPDFGFVADTQQFFSQMDREKRLQVDINKVPLSIHWIEYFGREWVKNIGEERINRIERSVPLFEQMEDGAVLFAIQNEPYDDSSPSHVARRLMVENELGLRELHMEYPSPGL